MPDTFSAEAIEFFIDRAEHYSIVAEDAAQQGGNQGATVLRDSALQQAETELQTLLERFANGQSMQPIFDAVKQLYRDASKDQELTCVVCFSLPSFWCAFADFLGAQGLVEGPRRVRPSRSPGAWIRDERCWFVFLPASFHR